MIATCFLQMPFRTASNTSMRTQSNEGYANEQQITNGPAHDFICRTSSIQTCQIFLAQTLSGFTHQATRLKSFRVTHKAQPTPLFGNLDAFSCVALAMPVSLNDVQKSLNPRGSTRPAPARNPKTLAKPVPHRRSHSKQ